VGWLRRTTGGPSGVGAQEAFERVREGALLLDVREPHEWNAGHAAGARHVPLWELPERLDALPRDRQVLVVCRSGHRSSRATSLLVRSGFDAVNLDGGMRAWVTAGLPLEAEDGGNGTVA
jgi:rhodanese-related sulfurtransferase